MRGNKKGYEKGNEKGNEDLSRIYTRRFSEGIIEKGDVREG